MKNIEDIRNFQRQNYGEIAIVSLKLFSSKNEVIEFHIIFLKDLEPRVVSGIIEHSREKIKLSA